jgi:hypothetical protein
MRGLFSAQAIVQVPNALASEIVAQRINDIR